MGLLAGAWGERTGRGRLSLETNRCKKTNAARADPLRMMGAMCVG